MNTVAAAPLLQAPRAGGKIAEWGGYSMRLSVITDEVSQNFEEAARFCVRHGMECVDIRSVEGKNPFRMTREDFLRVKEICEKYDLSVACIDAPMFKCSIRDAETVRAHVDEFRRLAPIAREIGCRLIRGFDFLDEGATLDERAQAFAPVIEICAEFGVTYALEYDPSVHACTPAKIRALLDRIDSPYVRALYDPGNAFFADADARPYPDEYLLLKDRIVHIHIKDAVLRDGRAQAVRVGTGLVDYAGLFRALAADGYRGAAALETHYRLSAALSDEQLRFPGGKAFTDGAYAASEESAESLTALTRQAE